MIVCWAAETTCLLSFFWSKWAGGDEVVFWSKWAGGDEVAQGQAGPETSEVGPAGSSESLTRVHSGRVHSG